MSIIKLGLSLIKDDQTEEKRAGTVDRVLAGQGQSKGRRVGDYIVRINNWWLPPLEHPRRVEMLDVLSKYYFGPVDKHIQGVAVVFARPEEANETVPHDQPEADDDDEEDLQNMWNSGRARKVTVEVTDEDRKADRDLEASERQGKVDHACWAVIQLEVRSAFCALCCQCYSFGQQRWR